jgi:hypothetical protein
MPAALPSLNVQISSEMVLEMEPEVVETAVLQDEREAV